MLTIAIDGPSGAGKSSVARALAERIGATYVDTGAMYRAIAYAGNEQNLLWNDPEKVAEFLAQAEPDYRRGKLYMNGREVGDEIRPGEISQLASKISVIPEIREFLVDRQRKIAGKEMVVMEGRDIGTVVFPDARVKIYLTADSESRAQRRLRQMEERGETGDPEEIIRAIEERDHRDKTRKHGPLKVAPDAVVVDSTSLTFEETVETLVDLVQSALKEPAR